MMLRRFLKAIGPGVGDVAMFAVDGEAGRDPAKVFNESQPEHDRDGPQFAEIQRSDCLVGAHKGLQMLGVDLSVHMRDQLKRQIIDPGQFGGRAG